MQDEGEEQEDLGDDEEGGGQLGRDHRPQRGVRSPGLGQLTHAGHQPQLPGLRDQVLEAVVGGAEGVVAEPEAASVEAELPRLLVHQRGLALGHRGVQPHHLRPLRHGRLQRVVTPGDNNVKL